MERKHKSSILGAGGALLMLGASLLAPLAAHAGADGRKNTAIALGAAAAYELLLKHQVVPGVVLGAGAAYAGKRYEDARRQESQNKDRYYYRNGYNNNNRNGYNNRNSNPYAPNNNGYYNNNNGYSNGYGDNGYNNNNGSNQGYQYQGRQDNDDNKRNRGNEHGGKRGWNGRDLPPGQYKKHHDNDDN